MLLLLLSLLLLLHERSKILPCYLSDEQFLTFLTFLATVNWVGYLKYISPAIKDFFYGRIVKASDKRPVTLIL